MQKWEYISLIVNRPNKHHNENPKVTIWLYDSKHKKIFDVDYIETSKKLASYYQ